MSCIAGRLAKVQISVDGGVTYANLGGLVDGSMNGTVDSLECTDHDSGGVREHLPNFFDATMDLTLRWDEDEPVQVLLEATVFPAPTTFKIYFYLEGTAGRRRYEADAFVTDWTPSAPLDDVAGLDVALQLSSVVLGVVP